MTNAPAIPVPVYWAASNAPPAGLDVCNHQALPPPEILCCVDRLLYPFGTAAASWTINHNRGKTPASVEIISPAGIVTTSRIIHTTTNQVVIYHASPTTGYAIILV